MVTHHPRMAAMKRITTTMITGPSMSVRRLSKPDKLKVFLKESKVSIFIFYVLTFAFDYYGSTGCRVFKQGYIFERFLPKNQDTPSELLNF